MNGAQSAGLTASTNPDNLDLLSQRAGQGAVALTNDIQEIQVSVERTTGDAEATEKQYGMFADQFSSRDHIKRYGTVVVAYTKSPTTSEGMLIEKCVK